MHADAVTKILIIDDDEVDQEITTRLLAQSDAEIKVDHVADVEAARERLKDTQYDCVIVDYLLPSGGSVELAKEFQHSGKPPFIGFVMLTGQGDEAIAAEAMKAGIHDYLTKENLTSSAVLRAVTNAVSEARFAQKSFYQRQALENFAGAVAHELRTPLNGIIGFLNLAIPELNRMATTNATDDFAENIEYLQIALSSAQHMDSVIQGLLSFARTGVNSDLKQGQLRTAVEDAVDLLEAEIQDRNAEIILEDLPSLHVNVQGFIQLFRNLITNALKYNGSDRPSVRIFSEEKGGQYVIGVKDNGRGVPADKLDEIFAPLHRGNSRDHDGLGLGLSICANIVEQHGGRIWCESTLGEGSVFYIALPAVARSVAA